MNTWAEATQRRLRAHLQAHVPQAIRDYLEKGGPNQEDYDRIQTFATEIGAHGDVILFPDGKGGEKPYLAMMVDSAAVAAFSPGGIRLFGLAYDAATFRQEPEQDELHQLLTDIDRILQETPRKHYGNAIQED
jgi:hypothetical protein